MGAWGEGAGSSELTQKTREGLVDAYLEGFPTTDLVMLLTDEATNGYGISKRNVGWRIDYSFISSDPRDRAADADSAPARG